MRKFSILLILFIISGCSNQKSFLFDFSKIKPGEKYIILMHPTVTNLKTFKYLTENKIFNLPEGYQAIGVYHSLEKFDYTKTENYLQEQGINDILLVKIESELNPYNLYKTNSGSELFKKLFENSRGAIFFGGPDIPPACYGEPTNLLTVITDPWRHYLELSFLFHLLGGSQDSAYLPFLESKPDYAILGICLGMQSINVATGGTMVQDIPAEIYHLSTIENVLNQNQNMRHRNYNSDYGIDKAVTTDNYHQVVIESSSPLASYLTADTIYPYVLSSHHQCLEKLGKNIVIAARSIDGQIVESIFHTKYHNVLGVQFHPEVSELYKPEEKIKEFPFKKAENSYLDLYSGDKGENFQRAIWKKFAEKFQ